MTVLQSMNISYDGYKFDVTEKNKLFSESKVYVMYHGENRNNSFISKENVDRAINSIYNIPIVGEFIESENNEEENNFGGHGGEVIVSDDDIKFIHTTRPMGVVPESASVYWEVVTDKNGEDKEYLVVDGALLWNRYEDAVNTLKSAEFGQSMELEVENGTFDDEDGLYNIEDFSFSAFCVLGLDDREGGKTEPAFEDSKIVTYSEKFSKELKEMKSELSDYFNFSSEEENDKEVKAVSKDKEKDFIDEKEIKEEVVVKEEETDETEDFDLEGAKEAVAKAEETVAQADVDSAKELVSELEDGDDKDKLSDRLAKVQGKIDAKKDEVEESELHEEEEEFSKEDYEAMESELIELRKFKENVERENHGKEAVESFEKLGLTEEDVKDIDIYEYTIEELEEKAYAILGRKLASQEPAKEDSDEDFSLEDKKEKNKINLSKEATEHKTNRYGKLFAKHGNK